MLNIHQIRKLYETWDYYGPTDEKHQQVLAIMRFVDFVCAHDPETRLCLCQLETSDKVDPFSEGRDVQESFVGRVEDNITSIYRFDFPKKELPYVGNVATSTLHIAYTPKG